jgi:hypothetical protein
LYTSDGLTFSAELSLGWCEGDVLCGDFGGDLGGDLWGDLGLGGDLEEEVFCRLSSRLACILEYRLGLISSGKVSSDP